MTDVVLTPGAAVSAAPGAAEGTSRSELPGGLRVVTETVPGGANHDLTVRRGSGVLERLGEGEGARVESWVLTGGGS